MLLFNSCGTMICCVSCTDNKFLYVDVSQAQIVSTIIEPGETAVNKSLEHFIAKREVYVYRFTLVVMVGGNKCHWYTYKIDTQLKHAYRCSFMGVASNEAEEAGASSLFCVRTHARIGDVL